MTESPPAAFLDTSVIVRYLTNDPPEMGEIAAQIIDSERPLVVSEVVLVETAYVLASVYAIPRAALVDAMSRFIQRRNIRLLHLSKTHALEALRLCRESGRHSFADAFVWAEATEAGISHLYTFDRRFPESGLELLSAPSPNP